MIGGNGYDLNGNLFLREKPPVDLYLRWMTVNSFMPMQVSIAPWRYDNSHNNHNNHNNNDNTEFEMYIIHH